MAVIDRFYLVTKTMKDDDKGNSFYQPKKKKIPRFSHLL